MGGEHQGMGALDQLDGWPARRAAGAVLGPAGPIAVHGPLDRPFEWASLTKLVTALAALVAVEEGTVALDAPAGPPGSTVRHLLAHASGLGFDGQVRSPPGARRIYSNAGFEVAAGVVAERAGMAFADYVALAVLEPLGMAATVWGGLAASGASGPLVDLIALAQELLVPTLVDRRTLAGATRSAFPDLAGVLPGFGRQSPNDWGLGLEVRGHKAPHWTGSTNSPGTFGHFGRAGGFAWVDPEAGLVCACLSDRDFGPWAAEAWPRLSDAVVAEHRDQAA